MARIEGVSPEKAGLFARFTYWMAKRRLGKLPEPLTVTAHHPKVFQAYGGYEYFIEKAHLVDNKLKLLADVKTASLVGCPFWIDIGSAVSRAAGVSEAQLRNLHNYKESALFSPLEKLVLDYAVAMTQTPVEVPDALFAELRKHFNEAQMVELTATIAWENYRARFDHAFGVESQGFSEGAYCALPERK